MPARASQHLHSSQSRWECSEHQDAHARNILGIVQVTGTFLKAVLSLGGS